MVHVVQVTYDYADWSLVGLSRSAIGGMRLVIDHAGRDSRIQAEDQDGTRDVLVYAFSDDKRDAIYRIFEEEVHD